MPSPIHPHINMTILHIALSTSTITNSVFITCYGFRTKSGIIEDRDIQKNVIALKLSI